MYSGTIGGFLSSTTLSQYVLFIYYIFFIINKNLSFAYMFSNLVLCVVCVCKYVYSSVYTFSYTSTLALFFYSVLFLFYYYYYYYRCLFVV